MEKIFSKFIGRETHDLRLSTICSANKCLKSITIWWMQARLNSMLDIIDLSHDLRLSYICCWFVHPFYLLCVSFVNLPQIFSTCVACIALSTSKIPPQNEQFSARHRVLKFTLVSLCLHLYYQNYCGHHWILCNYNVRTRCAALNTTTDILYNISFISLRLTFPALETLF